MREPTREVRVESLDGLEADGDVLRLTAVSTDAGRWRIVLPRTILNEVLSDARDLEGPTPGEIEELWRLKSRLAGHAEEGGFDTFMEGVQCGGTGSRLEYDLVLRPAGLFAATTGYHFAPVVGPEVVEQVRAGLREDRFVEQAYAVGAVAGPEALAGGDENLRVLSVRGRRSTASRFEMPPELWQVLSGPLGWDDVETYIA